MLFYLVLTIIMLAAAAFLVRQYGQWRNDAPLSDDWPWDTRAPR